MKTGKNRILGLHANGSKMHLDRNYLTSIDWTTYNVVGAEGFALTLATLDGRVVAPLFTKEKQTIRPGRSAVKITSHR